MLRVAWFALRDSCYAIRISLKLRLILSIWILFVIYILLKTNLYLSICYRNFRICCNCLPPKNVACSYSNVRSWFYNLGFFLSFCICCGFLLSKYIHKPVINHSCGYIKRTQSLFVLINNWIIYHSKLISNKKDNWYNILSYCPKSKTLKTNIFLHEIFLFTYITCQKLENDYIVQ